MTIHTMNKIKLFLVLVLINFTAVAKDASALEPRHLIKSTADEVIARVIQDREALENDPYELYELVNTSIVPHVDLTRMSRWILGKHWRKASKTQKRQFVNEFRKILIRTYSSALVKFSDEKIVYPPLKESTAQGKVTVKSEVIMPDGQRFSVNYRMHNKDEDKGWRVYDISVNGVSLIATYRNSFTTEIRRVGIDGLLSNMQRKNKGLKI